jgi:ATP-dependent Clp protease ATP-binding subunit ClpC
MREKIVDESKRVFKPEFLNRLDDVIVFHSLSKPDLIRILDLEIAKVDARLKPRGLTLVLDDKAKDFLVTKGYDPTYGARPMRRAVERYLEDPLAEERLRGSIVDGEPVNVTAEGDKLVFSQKAAAEGALPVS